MRILMLSHEATLKGSQYNISPYILGIYMAIYMDIWLSLFRYAHFQYLEIKWRPT